MRKLAARLLKYGLALIILMMFFSCGPGKQGMAKKAIILGFDGMDPNLLSRWMAAGELPNFRKLAKSGDFKPILSSIPPESPVAWSNLITGMNPGGHGIFDFIHRDPATYIPYLSTSKTEPPKKTVVIGKYKIPLKAGEVKLLRNGKSFWEVLDHLGIPVVVDFMPSNFPPVKIKGLSISGMGTPDILGGYGTFSYFTDNPPPSDKEISGGKVFQVGAENFVVHASLPGPYNTFLADEQKPVQAEIPFEVYLDPQNDAARVDIQDHQVLLKKGEWSGWIAVKFEMVPYLIKISGQVRMLLKEAHPHFGLYISPVNIDPIDPAMPISTDAKYGKRLAEKIGRFHTLGIPEDTKALSADILNYGEFLGQSRIVRDERIRGLQYELARFKDGLLFYYFSSTDQNSHMFWRNMDKNHPARIPERDDPYSGVILEMYKSMESVLGEAMAKIDPDTLLIVVSDHGFSGYYRSIQVNSWLLDNGYTAITDPSTRETSEFFMNVDWSRTKAYALGLNSLYINKAGREGRGIVGEIGAQKLVDEICEKLLALTDPATNEHPIYRCYKTRDEYTGPYVQDAPDIILGYARGYRGSWETALGKFPNKLFGINRDAWSGDHCMAMEVVPGIVLSNKKITNPQPHLYDVAPTILTWFGQKPLPEMVGKNLFAYPE